MHHRSIAALALLTAVGVAAPAAATPVQQAGRAASAAAGSYSLTARINKTVAIGDETVLKVRGKVTPKAAGEKVVLQQRVGNKSTWRATGTSKIKNDGTYLLKDDPSTPGPRQYRVLKPASGGIAKGFSKALGVEVYAWQRLALRPSGPAVNVALDGVMIGADYYPESLVSLASGKPSSVEYTLGRKCLEMRASYALTDQSASGSSGSVTVSADGSVVATHPLAVGTVVADESLDVTDAYRIRVDMTTSASPAGIVAVATPEVLCTR